MKHVALALAFALLPACSQARPAPQAHPALWKAYDADTTVYLFGTIHALPAATKWQSAAIDTAMAKSDALVLEVANLQDAAKIGDAFRAIAMAPNLPPVLDRVPAGRRAALKAELDAAKLPLAVADRYKTWAIVLSLAGLTMEKIGASRDAGVERVVQDGFASAHKPVEGLETAAQQFGFFDQLSEDAQRKLLLSTLEPDAKVRAEYARMVSAWSAGDVRRIAVSFDEELKESPELTEALLARRNAAWTDWIAQRMQQPGTVFIAVGAGHLAGPGSVEALLAKRGIKVARVQ